MKNLKIFVFTLIAVFTIGFCFNVNAEDIATLNEIELENGTLKLKEDLTLENQFQYFDIINKTLDLNGHNIYTNGHDLTAIGDVSIKDSSNEKIGKISNGSGSATSNVLIFVGTTSTKSTLTLESGTIEAKGNTWTVYPVNGDFVMNGGTIDTEYIFRTGGGDITINGGTINSKVSGNKNLFDVTANHKLTVNGGTINNNYVGTGTISIGTIDLKDNASFEMNGGTINSNMSGIVSNSNNTVTINDGIINARSYALAGNGSKSNTNFSINGGKLISEEAIAIYAPQKNGVTTIKGGIIKGDDSAVELRAGKLNITGGTFTATSNEYRVESNGNGPTTTGATIAVAQHTTKEPIEVSITGGTFNGYVSFSEANPENNPKEDIEKVSASITGGVFNAEGSEVVKSVDLTKFISGGKFNKDVDSSYLPGNNSYIDDEGNVKTRIGNYDLNVTGTYTYNSKAIIPEITLKDENGEEVELTEDDFDIDYYNNTDAGKATVTVTGKGRYTKSVSTKFTINKADISNMDVSGIVDKEYTGKAITQNLSIEGLTSDDYDVTYANNTAIGTAEITITGKNNYTGEINKTFDITKANISNYEVTGIKNNEFYTGNAITQNIEVKKGSVTLVKDTDYEITYSNNTNVGTANIVIEGKGNYTGTINKTFNIVQNNIDNLNISGIKDVTYTGEAIKQDNLVIKNGDITLVEGTDYKIISYSNNIDVGTATIKIKGEGKYTGEAKRTFKIKPMKVNAKDIKITGIINKLYTKYAVKLSNLKVTYKDKEVLYNVKYSNNVNIGKASITITLKGNYTGQVTKSFNIVPVKIGIKSVKAKKKKVKVTYYQAAGNVKYQIAYRKNGTKKWKYVTSSNGSKTIKKLKSKKFYTFKVRAFKVVKGVTYNGAWSDTKSVRVK